MLLVSGPLWRVLRNLEFWPAPFAAWLHVLRCVWLVFILNVCVCWFQLHVILQVCCPMATFSTTMLVPWTQDPGTRWGTAFPNTLLCVCIYVVLLFQGFDHLFTLYPRVPHPLGCPKYFMANLSAHIGILPIELFPLCLRFSPLLSLFYTTDIFLK